tara:strand:- start:400 stop:642 length:243 start_codon:yes stop_codon:yes gene_type:complete
MGLPTILLILGDKMGEAICTIIALLFIFGSMSIFMSLITDKHYHKPVKHSAIDNDLADVMIVDQVFNDDDIQIDEDLLED